MSKDLNINSVKAVKFSSNDSARPVLMRGSSTVVVAIKNDETLPSWLQMCCNEIKGHLKGTTDRLISIPIKGLIVLR